MIPNVLIYKTLESQIYTFGKLMILSINILLMEVVVPIYLLYSCYVQTNLFNDRFFP